MRDFEAYVRAHIAPLELPDEQESKIVDELADALEERYEALRAAGRSAEAAWTELEREVPDWAALRGELLEAAPLPRRLAHPERGPFAGALERALVGRLQALAGRSWAQDLRVASRRARRERGYSLTTLLTLAVCLGANAAVFTVVHSVILRPLPLPDADRIVAFADQFPAQDTNFRLLNNARSYFDRPDAVPAVVDQAMFRASRRAIDVDGRAEQTFGLEVTATFFDLVRTLPELGRPFTDADSEAGSEHKIILSHGLWQQLYASDPAAIDRDVELDGRSYTVVGVMPPGFVFFDPAARFWIPLTFTDDQRFVDTPATRLTYGFYHMGRLRPGADVAEAQAQVDALNAANIERFPGIRDVWINTRFHTIVVPLQEALVRDISGILYLLWAGALFVLLIGASNIASLSLARSSVRARELGTRFALGASRWRVTRLLVLESLLLAGAGGVAGLVIAKAILAAIEMQLPMRPDGGGVEMGWVVAAFTLGSAACVGALIGLGAAGPLLSRRSISLLGAASRGRTSGRSARALRHALVVGQIAITIVLIVGAALLLETFRNLLRVDPGFEPDGVVTAALQLPPERYADDDAVRNFTDRLLDAIRAIPGVRGAGITTNIPMGTGGGWSPIIAETYEAAPGEPVVSPWRVHISPGYLEAIGMRLARGRGLEERDRADAEPVMLIDERLAERFWGDRDPVGERMYAPTDPRDLNRTDEDTVFYTVVGVVRNVELRDLSGAGARAFGAFYLPQAQVPARAFYVAIRTAMTPGLVIESLRSELAALDPQLPLADVRTMPERMDTSLTSRRLAVGLAGAFGIVALSLAALGVYGVLAYLVAQRRREIAIRVALGSSSRAVFRLVLSEGLQLTAVGLLLGVAAALAVARVLDDQVFGIAPTDPIVLVAAVLVTGAVALLASVVPARSATRVDPTVALSDL